MTNEEKDHIRKVQKMLFQIKETGRAPINLTLYQKLGLVKIIRKTVTLPGSGKKEMRFDRLVLTDKAKQFLNVIV